MADNPKELLATIAPFGLRMQSDLKERIKAAAEKNNRSMNSEIIARLEASFLFSETDAEFRTVVEEMGQTQGDVGNAAVSPPPMTVASFDELFGGSRLATEVAKLREELAKTIERPRRTKLTDEEKEDIWRWLQKKEKPTDHQD